MIELDDVRAAAARLAGVAHRTPVLTSRTLDERTGAEVHVKAESFQRGGAFKFRGAYNKISSLPPEALARGVFAFSSGNHAQAVAIASAELGTHATILMPLGRARGEGRGDARLRRRDRHLRPLRRRTARSSARGSPRSAASSSSAPTTTRS